MSKFYGLVFLIFISGVTIFGCGKDGSTGPAGAQGPPAAPSFEAVIQNGVYQNGAYTGEIDTWLDAGANTTSESSTGYRRVMVGANLTNYSRVINRFDVSSIPSNATVLKATLELTTMSSTSIGASPVTVGLHSFVSTMYPGCLWTLPASWVLYNGIGSWSACSGDSSVQQEGYINNPALSTVVFTNSINGVSKVYEWSIPTSTVQSWIAGTNEGLILKSEGEFSEPTANVDFYPYNSTTATNNPILIVDYQ